MTQLTTAISINVADREGLVRFEEWCLHNGVSANRRQADDLGFVIKYYLAAEGMIGIYDVAEDDVPLVKLRWSGVLV
jgi:hypothetical protein